MNLWVFLSTSTYIFKRNKLKSQSFHYRLRQLKNKDELQKIKQQRINKGDSLHFFMSQFIFRGIMFSQNEMTVNFPLCHVCIISLQIFINRHYRWKWTKGLEKIHLWRWITCSFCWSYLCPLLQKLNNTKRRSNPSSDHHGGPASEF